MSEDDIVTRLGRLYTSAVHDVLRGLGHERCVLPPRILPRGLGGDSCLHSGDGSFWEIGQCGSGISCDDGALGG